MKNYEFTDIHCHIIPQVDDGSDSIETSLRLASMMYDDGIRRVITTPHFGIINPIYDPVRVAEQFELLSNELSKIHPDMKLYRGNEIFISPGYSDGLDDRMSCTMADSNYVLVEFDESVDYDTLYHELRKLLLRGYSPILAHAERYMYAYRNVKQLASIVNQGVLIQINCNSICSLAERKSLFSAGHHEDKILREMLAEGMVHFIATDCHDMPGREPHMTEAAKVMEGIIGEDRTREILEENPKLIIC